MPSDTPDNPKDDEIPLLQDVVTPENVEIDSELILFEDPGQQCVETSTPNYDEVLLAMRDDIFAQLERELRPLVSNAVEKAVDEATGRLAQIMHDELNGPLEQRLRTLIAQRMEQEFGPREPPLDLGEEE